MCDGDVNFHSHFIHGLRRTACWKREIRMREPHVRSPTDIAKDVFTAEGHVPDRNIQTIRDVPRMAGRINRPNF
jgi:hypothetical protein